jgi:hypothetical protein
LTLASNGILSPMPLDDAIGVAKMLVRLGRAIPFAAWVDQTPSAPQKPPLSGLF